MHRIMTAVLAMFPLVMLAGCTLFNLDIRRDPKDTTKPLIREQKKQEKELEKVKDVQEEHEKTIEKQEKTLEKQKGSLEKQQKAIEELKEEKK